MITFLKQERVLILFVALLFTFHWFSKDITDPYERPIVGDAQGYYSYLPALFIYNDLDYGFIATDAAQYYPADGMKNFIFEVNGEKVNKTFPGVAILYAPFFFLAHGSAYLLGFETDGFSTIYQLWFDLGVWFYFLFGLIFMRKLLEKLHFSSKIVLFSTILIGFGTNMLFYVVYDQSVTHIFNFFMINGMLLSLVLWEEQKKLKWLLIAFFLLALIGITRPTNFLVFGLILFFFNKKSFFKGIIGQLLSKNSLKIVAVVLPVFMVPFLLWKAQTGNWVVYSYGEEGFDFSNPHFLSFILGYTKGWLTYTPIVLPILLIGFYALFKQSWKRAAIGLCFYLVSIYIFSSWWCWYYGAGMSQRVMIDHYILLAFLLALSLKYLETKKVLRYSFISLLLFFAALNVAQAYQIKNGIIKNGSTTKTGYWDSFLVFQKRARVYPQEHWDYIEGKDISKPNWVTSVEPAHPYSSMASAPMKDICPGSKLIFSFEAWSGDDVQHTRAVLMLRRRAMPQDEISLPFFLSEYITAGEDTYFEFMFEPSEVFMDSIKLYFWNGESNETVVFKNVKYQHYYSEEYL